MRHLLLKLKGTLPSVLASLMLLVWAGSSFAQVPSASAPPFQPSTFSAAATFAAPQTGAGDLFCIVGSATRLIKVKQFNVSGTNSTAQTSLFNLVKRSTANTGGTATAPAACWARLRRPSVPFWTGCSGAGSRARCTATFGFVALRSRCA
jgi:hypothetical protein